MLEVQVIDKFYDKNMILVGYVIRDRSGKTMSVTKEQLKNAVVKGQVTVVNMTLTSDGRFIGASTKKDLFNANVQHRPVVAPAPVQKPVQKPAAPKQVEKPAKVSAPATPGIKDVFGKGRNIIAYMVEENGSKVLKSTPGEEINIGDIKKKQFKAIRTKLVDTLKKSGVELKFEVVKHTDDKSVYDILIPVSSVKAQNTIVACLYDAAIDLKVQVLKATYGNSAVLTVRNTTGIGDVRKIAKSIK